MFWFVPYLMYTVTVIHKYRGDKDKAINETVLSLQAHPDG